MGETKDCACGVSQGSDFALLLNVACDLCSILQKWQQAIPLPLPLPLPLRSFHVSTVAEITALAVACKYDLTTTGVFNHQKYTYTILYEFASCTKYLPEIL